MSTAEIIEQALKLKASERYEVVDAILESLDKPDPEIDAIWQEECLRRLSAYQEGRMDTVSLEEALGDDV